MKWPRYNDKDASDFNLFIRAHFIVRTGKVHRQLASWWLRWGFIEKLTRLKWTFKTGRKSVKLTEDELAVDGCSFFFLIHFINAFHDLPFIVG